jgi:formylglycine-generating enzyme required for sulfatase activity/tRNA A-37 threonylcarbamoyl transferase component Bud32
VERHLETCEACRSQFDTRLPDSGRTEGANSASGLFGVAASAKPPDLPEGLREHPRYRVVGLLGAGGMGAVYRAEHRLMKRSVALKVITPSLVKEPSTIERFRREVEAAARLAHPNIVTAYDAEQAGDTHFLVMEFVEGVSLAQRVDRHGPPSVGQACDCIRQAALGLQHAHERGMVHRDIKPQNLMLAAEGQVKVLDFGLARFASESSQATTLTHEHAVMGTPAFLAPEQSVDAHRADIRADIYSLGCTFYFMLSGQPPFPGSTFVELLTRHQTQEPTAIEKLRPDVPPEVAAIVRRMMAKVPADRYQTPAEVVQALEPWARREVDSEIPTVPAPEAAAPRSAGSAGSATLALPVSTPGPGPDRWRWLRRGALTACVIIIAACAVVLWQGSAVVSTGEPKTTPVPVPQDPLSLDLGEGVILPLVQVARGSFRMGAPDTDKDATDDEKPQHEVVIPTAFFLGKFLVTQQQYQRVMGKNPSFFAESGGGRGLVARLDTRRFPVDSVSWNDASEFCIRVSVLTNRKVQLPLEAEWEYACRAGTESRYYCGDRLLISRANFGTHVGRTSEVGQYQANPWGLFDMTGNLWQWCADGKRKYTADPVTAPVGPTTNSFRVLRGGSWNAQARYSRSSYKITRHVSQRDEMIGFRVLVRPD